MVSELNTAPVLSANEATLSAVTHKLCGLKFDASPFPMWVFAQGTLEFLAVNDAAVMSYGFDRSQFLSMSILEIRPAEDVRRVVREALRPHECYGELERWRHKSKNGEVFEVELTCHQLLYQTRSARLVVVRRQKPLKKPAPQQRAHRTT